MRWLLFLALKQLAQQILYLGQHDQSGGDAYFRRQMQLATNGIGVVEEDEVGVLPGVIGEVPGAQVLGEVDGPPLPQLLQREVSTSKLCGRRVFTKKQLFSEISKQLRKEAMENGTVLGIKV